MSATTRLNTNLREQQEIAPRLVNTAVGMTVTTLPHPPLPAVGVPIRMERGRQQNDSPLADGQVNTFVAKICPPVQGARLVLAACNTVDNVSANTKTRDTPRLPPMSTSVFLRRAFDSRRTHRRSRVFYLRRCSAGWKRESRTSSYPRSCRSSSAVSASSSSGPSCRCAIREACSAQCTRAAHFRETCSRSVLGQPIFEKLAARSVQGQPIFERACSRSVQGQPLFERLTAVVYTEKPLHPWRNPAALHVISLVAGMGYRVS